MKNLIIPGLVATGFIFSPLVLAGKPVGAGEFVPEALFEITLPEANCAEVSGSDFWEIWDCSETLEYDEEVPNVSDIIHSKFGVILSLK
ncbi:hypothetical protein [Psychromonas hadalis]|uniref:hypothetical protein n=1 Tax=Psychromonas hadalis TaxID=211669 RepID=UPI0003B65631|nr:hypothetical protein [Psychromonas hadalis]